VEELTAHPIVVSLKIAQALGLSMLSTLFFQADEVIRQAAHRRIKIGRFVYV